jgi:hypothetical protein
MIYDSKAQQTKLHEAIAQQHQSASSSPYIKAMAQRDFLKDQIQRLQQQKPLQGGSASPMDPQFQSDLQELESQVALLQKNHDELENLLSQMQKKAQGIAGQQDKAMEKDKLERSVEDLKIENYRLKSELTNLRNQMVELDKRKTRLSQL